jgi:hypothetical protein
MRESQFSVHTALYASYRHKSIDLSLLKRLECCALSVSRRKKGAGEFLRDQ